MNDFTIITILSSILAWISAQKWIFPFLLKCYEWVCNKKKEQLDITDELNAIKQNETEYYKQTFETLLNQIQSLEEELERYSSELEKLRKQILKLNSKLYDKSVIISSLQYKCCARENCKDRILCDNFIKNV